MKSNSAIGKFSTICLLLVLSLRLASSAILSPESVQEVIDSQVQKLWRDKVDDHWYYPPYLGKINSKNIIINIYIYYSIG